MIFFPTVENRTAAGLKGVWTTSGNWSLDHGSPLRWAGFSPLLDASHSQSLPSCAGCSDDVLEFEVPFSSGQRCRNLPHTDLVLIPASRTLLSLESLKVITTLHFATLNSSTRDERGSCSCPDLIYSPTDVKLVGIPSHFRRYSLILHSTPSTAVSGISYTVNSYISLGSRPCWYIQALNFPGSPDFSMFFSQPSACFSVLWTLLLSRSDSSYHFPRCIMGLSFIDGLISPCMTEFVSDVAFLNNHTP